MTIEPPKSDELFVELIGTSTMDRGTLVAHTMEMRDCSKPDAECYIDTFGARRVESEINERWVR